MSDSPTPQPRPEWQAILARMISDPGKVSACYTAFHDYSFRNRAWAEWQLEARGIPIGPISTFKGWIAKGRCVSKGQKAISLCMPCLITDKKAEAAGEDGKRNIFIWRNNWFAVSQTAPIEGADQVEPAAVSPLVWNEAQALAKLDIQRTDYASTDGNCQGYASGRSLAINPVASLPFKTLFHEVAHIVLGHTTETAGVVGIAADSETTPRTLKEVEAESVAYLCCQTLGLPGAMESRGYVQHWLARYGADAIPEKSAAKVMGACEKILSAGSPAKPKREAA